ncbi:MAG: Na+/H+ antiporter subunit G [Nitriliruptorales bacterium]|nr:Na+/H+ antiporter subunit G [Nitriliruptorales bacterium]
MSILEIAVGVLVLAGVAFATLAALGLQQFDDVFARMHAATKPATLGLVLLLLAVALRLGAADAVAKLALVAVLQFITAPVGAHMVGRAAFRAGTELSSRTEIDELAVERLGLTRRSE